jgi:TolB-like protein
MSGIDNRFSKFWLELKRRKTDRVIVVYAAAAFTIIQLVPTLQTALFLPQWTTTVVVIIIAVGFPIAAIFSWFYEIVPGGIEKTKPLGDKSRTTIQTQLRTWKSATLISIMVIIGLVLFNVISSRIEASEIRQAEKTIAVLPFDNLSTDEDLSNTSDVVTAIIINELSKINELTVRSRSSVLEFKAKKRPNPEIARKLKVFFVVTGELLKNKNHILLNVNLIRAKKDKIIWADHYTIDQDDDIDIEKINEIPVKIAYNLLVSLTPETKSKIKSKPTRSAAAYMNYVQGNNSQDDAHNSIVLVSTGDSIFKDLSASTSFDKAIEFYDKAIKADSTFALAYAKRSITRSWGCRAGHFTSKDDMGKCRNDAEYAMLLDKTLTEAWIATGFYYYYFEEDFNKALEWFGKVKEREPDDWQCKYYMALVLRANDEWKKSQSLMAEVGKSNPQDALVLTNIGLSYHCLHNYDTAVYYHDKAIQIMPRWTGPYDNKIESMISRDGNTREAEVVMDTALLNTSGGQLYVIRIQIDLYNGRYNEALFKAGFIDPSKYYSQGEKDLLFAKIYSCLNNPSFAREYYKSAFEFYNKRYTNDPRDLEALSFKAIAAAGLNDRINAIEWSQNAVNLSRNFADKADRKTDLAQIYVMVKEYGKALDLIEELISSPSNLSIGKLRLDPVWRPLLEIPEFKEIIAKYSKQK